MVKNMHSQIPLLCRIQVAENMKMGDVGTRERESEALTRIAAIESENLRQQNERSQAVEKSNNELRLVRMHRNSAIPVIMVLNRLLQSQTLAICLQTHKDGNGARSGSPVSAVTGRVVNRALRETQSPLGLKVLCAH